MVVSGMAAACAAFGLWDAIRQRRLAYLGGVVLALAGPMLWLILGRVSHGDAWFFCADLADLSRQRATQHRIRKPDDIVKNSTQGGVGVFERMAQTGRRAVQTSALMLRWE